MIGPVGVYFVRLPDDDREITKVVAGVCTYETNKVFVRGYWTPDDWGKWPRHAWFTKPVMLNLIVSREDPGMVIRVGAVVPLAELPRDQWGEEYEGEEWRNQVPPGGALGTLELGVLVRYERAFRFGGHLLRESADLLRSAMKGETKEPWEQGLSA
jgi:hypothetical protein